jgi:hypothetical protein
MRRARALLSLCALTAALQPLQLTSRRTALHAVDDDIVLEHDYKRSTDHPGSFSEDVIEEIDELIALRSAAKKDKNYKQADALRDELSGCYDVYVDDALREWRAGAPPEPKIEPIPVYEGPTTGGFGIVDEDAEWERRRIPAGRKPLDAQRSKYFELDGEGTQVWARAKGRDFFVGRVKGGEAAVAMQFDLIDWSAKELHLPLGASRKVAYLLAKDAEREDVAAWEATPNREAQPSSLQAPSDAVDVDLTMRTADKVGFLAAKSPLPPTTLGNLVKRWRTRGQSASDLTPEMRPTGSAAGNTGRAKR